MSILRNTAIPFERLTAITDLLKQHVNQTDPAAEFDGVGAIRGVGLAMAGGSTTQYVGVAIHDDAPIGILLGFVSGQMMEVGTQAHAVLLHVDASKALSDTGVNLLKDFESWAESLNAQVVKASVSNVSGMPDLREYRQVHIIYAKHAKRAESAKTESSTQSGVKS